MSRRWTWGEFVAGVLFTLATLGLISALVSMAHSAESLNWQRVMLVSPGYVAIVDGDTVRLDDDRLVRLQGYNTPEIFHPKCPAERDLGLKAKARLIELAKLSSRLTINSGSCAYGRACGTLTVLTDKLEDVGDVLIRERLAEPMACTSRCPPPRDWCGG